jgi:hypothetical protein
LTDPASERTLKVMNAFFARTFLLLWFFAMFAFWLDRTALSLSTVTIETWQVHLSFVIAIVVLTNLVYLTHARYIVAALPLVYFSFIFFRSRAYLAPGSSTTMVDMIFYFLEIACFTIIVFWNYTVTDGKPALLSRRFKPTLTPPAWRRTRGRIK